jgi:hypothetical protein
MGTYITTIILISEYKLRKLGIARPPTQARFLLPEAAQVQWCVLLYDFHTCMLISSLKQLLIPPLSTLSPHILGSDPSAWNQDTQH